MRVESHGKKISPVGVGLCASVGRSASRIHFKKLIQKVNVKPLKFGNLGGYFSFQIAKLFLDADKNN